jgi:acetyl esterase
MIATSERLGFPKWHEQTPEKARRQMLREIALVEGAPDPIDHVEDLSIPGPAAPLRARVYRPRAAAEALPVVVFFHGGGFVVGSIRTHDRACRTLARHARAVVVSVEYRLAPEHPYPAAVDDAEAAFLWVCAHAREIGGDAARVAVAGDSAGGNLSAVISRRRRDAGGKTPCAQILIYPATDLTRSFASHERFARGFLLEREGIEWFLAHYAADERAADASPLFAESLAGLPPAIVVTAGFDPLRDEGEAYATKLRDAGTRVIERREPALPHGFINLPSASSAARAGLHAIAREAGRLLREA